MSPHRPMRAPHGQGTYIGTSSQRQLASRSEKQASKQSTVFLRSPSLSV